VTCGGVCFPDLTDSNDCPTAREVTKLMAHRAAERAATSTTALAANATTFANETSAAASTSAAAPAPTRRAETQSPAAFTWPARPDSAPTALVALDLPEQVV